MEGQREPRGDPVVLVGVLKDRRDLQVLRRDGWYRIPVTHAPARRFAWLAFYQPASFGLAGGCIRYLAPVIGHRIALRRTLLPDEPGHPRADRRYLRYAVGRLLRLPAPVRNATPRRLTFAYTTLRKLYAARDLFGVFTAAPLEPLMGTALRGAGIPALREFTVTRGTAGRFRLDFAVFCRNGALAIECDGDAAHGSRVQRHRDLARDRALRRLGWTTLRLGERDILGKSAACVRRVRAVLARLGGAV